MDVSAIQNAIREQGFDGWLLYDFRGQNTLARRVLKISPDKFLSRRWFYFIPGQGEPRKLVHKIEPAALDHLPGSATTYSRWQDFEAGVGKLVTGAKRIAMEYVPRNANPYVSRVDAGTIELVRSFGTDIQPSGDLVQQFEATWDDDQWQMHLEAAKYTREAFDVVFHFIASEIRKSGFVHELDVQARILQHFRDKKMTWDHPPIVGVGPHSGDPHYEPHPGAAGKIGPNQFVLVDLWGKLDKPRGVVSDLTRCGFTGQDIPHRFCDIFAIAAKARDTAINRIKDAFAQKAELRGWQVDRACRDVIDQAGYGEFFTHRTGHSIGEETHGNGANMDDLETHEERSVMPRTCFSIEPGIYLPEFGVRTEVNVFVDKECRVHVTGGDPQTELARIIP